MIFVSLVNLKTPKQHPNLETQENDQVAALRLPGQVGNCNPSLCRGAWHVCFVSPGFALGPVFFIIINSITCFFLLLFWALLKGLLEIIDHFLELIKQIQVLFIWFLWLVPLGWVFLEFG